MSDERITTTTTTEPAGTTPPPQTVVIERRGGGGMLVGLAVLALVVLLGFFLFNRSQNDGARTDAITEAASKVGDSAEKAGEAVKAAVR